MTPQTAAKGLLALGAKQMMNPAVRQATDDYHEALRIAAEGSPELIASVIMGALAEAAALTQSGQYSEVCDIIKAMTDEIFTVTAEKFDVIQSEVLH